MGRVDDILKKMGNTTSNNGNGKTESRVDSIIKKMKTTSYKPDASILDSFATDFDTFVKTATTDYDSLNYNNASNKSEEYKQSSLELKKRLTDIEVQYNLRRSSSRLTEEEKKLKDYLVSARRNLESLESAFYDTSKFYSQFETEDEYNEWYKKDTKRRELESPKEAEDYEEYTKLGAGVNNPSYMDLIGEAYTSPWQQIIGSADKVNAETLAKIGNVVTFAESNPLAFGGENQALSEMVDLINRHMKDDEKQIYNYYIGKGDRQKADEYLTYVMDVLRQREGGRITEAVDGKFLLEEVFSFAAGVDTFFSGVGNIDNLIKGTESDPTTSTQYAYGETSSNNKGFDKVVNDLLNSTGNMLPSILVGSVTGGIGGALTMGVSSAGNGYAEMRNLGYNEWQSRGYGVLVGASEAALQYALGGISPLGNAKGGMLSKATEAALKKVDNALARFAIEVGANMFEEGFEEAAQSVLEPIFKHILTGEKVNVDWGEVAYSGLLGALSAGVLEGAPTLAGTVSNIKNAKNVYKNEAGVNLVYESIKNNPDNAYAQKMKSRLDAGKDLTGTQLYSLAESNERSLRTQDVAKMKDAAQSRLTELGESGDVSKLADVIVKAQTGEKLTLSERKILENSKYGRRVSNELNPKNIESGEYSSKWAEGIGTERINTEAYNRGVSTENETPTTQPEASTTPENTTPQKEATISETAPLEENAVVGENKVLETVSDNAETATAIDTEDGKAVKESSETLENVSSKYGAQAQAMVHTYVDGQDVEQYDKAYNIAYDMGKSGVSLSYVMDSKATSYLTEKQRELAYEAGQAAADTAAKEQDAKIKGAATGKTGRRKGAVQGRDVKIEDLKKTFNDTQNIAYKILSTAAEATGIDIVLYKSETDADGNFVGAQGKFNWSDDKIYIDINAGLKNVKSVDELSKYAMVRSFSHEFTHFLEKYNSIWYNELRKAVFDTLTARGENVNDLIETKMSQNKGMSYEKASREVVAEAMTDILPDSHFVETLANKHKNIFESLLEKLKEFLSDIKAYFSTLGHNRSREANALKEQVGETVRYVENIVKLFDKVAVEAVENYQATVAFEEKAEKIDSTVTKKAENIAKKAENKVKAEKTPSTKESVTEHRTPEVVKEKAPEGIKGLISGKQGYPFNTYPNNTTFMINHIISVVEGITESVNAWRAALEETKKDMAEQEKLIDEPFAKQAELDEKRKRYNEVMEILNPKEEQSLDSVAEDTVQEQSRDYLGDDDITEDIYYPKSPKEASMFLRSFANKTSALKEGETAKVVILTENRVYFTTATGYLRGEIESYIEITSKNAETIKQLIGEFKNGTHDITERTHLLAESIRNAAGRGSGRNAITRYRGEADRDVRVDRAEHGGNVERGDGGGSSNTQDLNEEQYQQRTDTLTDREVLELASNEVKVSDLNQAERDALTIFQDRLAKLKTLQDDRAEQGRLYKEQQFGAKVDRAEAEKTLNRMKVLDGQIKKATADVLSVEEKEVLKRVLNKARKVVEAKEREHGQEILARWRDRRNNAEAIKKYRDRLRGDVDELTNWIISPDNKDIAKHVPDVLKNSVIPFLSSINFMSKRSLKGGDATVSDKEFIKRLDALKSAIKTNIDVYGMYSGYNDLPADFMESLENFRKSAQSLIDKSAGEFIINQMTSDELRELSKVVRTLKKYIMQLNRFHNNAMYQHVYEAGDNSIDFLKELDNAGGHTGGLSNFLFWQQIRPAYAFERFGEGGQAIYDGLRQGQSKLAFNTKEIENFTKKAYTEKEVKAWEDEIKTFSLGKDLVKIPVSHLMSFYELSKDPEALEHINGEGIRVATYTRKGKKISDVGHILTVGEFNQLIGSLTDRQREVADSLQKYMAEQGGKWGNFVSVARFGEEKFTNPKYFPINPDGRHLSATVDEHPSAAALYALLNMSFTKARKEGANNRIVIYSIFDVFANHMASMAQYNAMALPILDALKWFNYQQVFVDDEGNKTVMASVREQLDRVYGVPDETRPGSGKEGYAETFIVNIIKAFNGTAAQGTPYDSLGLKSMHRYNVSQVAYNLRVVVQQPLAITRAGMIIDYKSIIKGMKLNPSAIKKNIEEMQNHSGIAAWKSLGFYDVNISRGLTHLIKHDSNWRDKVGDVGMWGAEKADVLTWAAIWSACKEEVIKKQHLTPESKGFYEAVTKLFEDVIYKTQVVDSVLTKNEFMRDKGTFARLVGSFMSEPTTNASMLIDAVDKYHLDMKRDMSKRDAWQKNGKMIGRRLYVYGVGAVLLAAVQAAADALRDDDDYEEWYEKWLEAFGGNLVDELMPFNKLPILSDFYDLAKELLSIFGVDTYGNPPSSVFMQWYDSLVKGTEIIYDKIMNEDTNYTWYGGIYKLLQAASGISGLPMASATREIITVWNNTIGTFAPSLKLKTYEPSELAQIRYAYEDGYLTAEEATEILLDKGLVDTESEAYFTIQGWEVGEGYSRYDAIYDAVRNGTGFDEAMNELISHGYTEKDVLSRVKSKIGEWYQGGEISKAQATDMLTKYSDMDSDEITETVNKWSSYVVTGIKYEDIDDEFMEGNITESRAIEMYVRYGSMTKEKATEKVTVLAFVKEHPETEGISYSAVNGYNTYCEPCGVPANTYYDAWKHKNTLSGEVKEQMMSYINTLSLSARQKDSLYFAFGWAESKLYEAPWH